MEKWVGTLAGMARRVNPIAKWGYDLWSTTSKNRDGSSGPLARPFACLLVRSFTRTTHSFACSALLASLMHSGAHIRFLAHLLTHSLALRKVND